MNFKEWVSSEENVLMQQVANLLRSWSAQVIATLNVEDGKVNIVFPKIQLESEESDERLHRHDKGWQAYKGLKTITDPSVLGWSKSQEYRFKQNMTYAVAKISKVLGLLFEAEVFMYLTSKGLHSVEDENIEAFHQEQIKAIGSKLGQARDQIFQMVKLHAAHLGEQIIQKTQRLIGCADMIWFYGGFSNNVSTTKNPADIQIGCSEYAGNNDRVGYSLKFGTETRFALADAGIKSTAEMLGATPKEIQVVVNSDYKMLPRLLEAIAKRQFKSPQQFVKLLNRLLTGGHFTFPAPRNYASSEVGGAEWSENYKKDFIVTDKPGAPLKARDNAVVTVTSVPTYMKMNYSVDGGSSVGTTLYFTPQGRGTITIKVTNLTSRK